MADNHIKLSVSSYNAAIPNTEAVIMIEGTPGTANLAGEVALTAADDEEGDWIYSATAEGRTGEVAVGGLDLDEQQGVIYSGRDGMSCYVAIEGSIMGEGTIAGDAGDSATLAILLNNTPIGFADEGYVDLGVAATYDMNVYAHIPRLTKLDVIRVAVINDGTEAQDAELAGGDLRIYGA